MWDEQDWNASVKFPKIHSDGEGFHWKFLLDLLWFSFPVSFEFGFSSVFLSTDRSFHTPSFYSFTQVFLWISIRLSLSPSSFPVFISVLFEFLELFGRVYNSYFHSVSWILYKLFFLGTTTVTLMTFEGVIFSRFSSYWELGVGDQGAVCAFWCRFLGDKCFWWSL